MNKSLAHLNLSPLSTLGLHIYNNSRINWCVDRKKITTARYSVCVAYWEARLPGGNDKFVVDIDSSLLRAAYMRHWTVSGNSLSAFLRQATIWTDAGFCQLDL